MPKNYGYSINAQTDSLPVSVNSLIHQLEELKPTRPSQIVQLLKTQNIAEEDLKPFADFDHPKKDSYGRRMAYKGDNYEIMVMSWNPGDFSAIHDHGFTTWGAVKIYGKAEHATFRWEDEYLHSLARWDIKSGDILGVGHSLIHQMGNPNQKPFISLHVYGHKYALDNITGEARIFDLKNRQIQRVNGGAFLNLKENDIIKTEEGPESDFPTVLRFNLETYKRMVKAGDKHAESCYAETFDKNNAEKLQDYLQQIINPETHKAENSIQWKILNRELKEAASVQAIYQQAHNQKDQFHRYAAVYDHLIGATSYESFMEAYIDFFLERYNIDFKSVRTLSIGCGTGLVEEHVLNKYGIDKDHIYGIDLSSSMIVEARKRIRADVGDLLELDPEIKKWDIAYSGLNVYQYLPHQRLEEAIRKTADILNPGGYFLGDFITPDHIRWYPNVMYSQDLKVFSFRTPELIEEAGSSFQESEIINVNFLNKEMQVHYAGKHKRFLAPVFRVRRYFEQYFDSVELYDAVQLGKMNPTDDSCSSTRYIVIARKSMN